MKKIIIILASVAFSCTNHCDDVVADFQKAQTMHREKKSDAAALYAHLETIPMDNVQDHSLVEDELMMVLIDIAIIEIQMEAWKKQHVDCLNDY